MLLKWDQTGERLYETGIDRGVIYPQSEAGDYPMGEAWNGLTSVTESPSGAESTALYANNGKYVNLISAEEFAATIGAYTFPDAFAACNGLMELAPGVFAGQQTRTPFGMTYRSLIGNDIQKEAYGYKLHFIYGASAAPSESAYNTINDSPEASEMSWEVSTTPVDVPGGKPSATIVVDSTKATPAQLKALEDIIYGKDYELTTTQPEDWEENYAQYFEKSGSEFTAVSGSGVAPSWAENKYYTGKVDARLPLPTEIATIMASED